MSLSLAGSTHAPHDHVVNLYDEFGDVVPDVVALLVDGLLQGEAAIIAASPPHRDLLEREIGAQVDLALARAEGRFVVLDAWETMLRFRVDGRFDPAAFRSVVGGLIAAAGRDGRGVRMYGEIVALLWEQGDRWAAIELETMWNDLAAQHRFTLSCSYPMASLVRAGDLDAIHAVCANHSFVTVPSSYVAFDDAAPSAGIERSNVFIADPLAIRAVRRFVVRALTDRDDAERGTAALVASELAANVVEHVGSPFRVTVRRVAGTLTVSVEDLSPARPEPVDGAVDAVRGRGFQIIDALCSRWGVDVGPSGKVVWAELIPE